MYKNVKRILLLIMFCVIADSSVSFSAINNENIRIGLEYKYSNVQSVNISDKEIMFGYEINGFYTPETKLNSSTGFVIKTSDNYYINVGNTYSSYEQALQKAVELNSRGIKSAPASLNNSIWTVYCGGYSSFNEASSVIGGLGTNAQVVAPNNKMTEITNGLGVILVCDNSLAYPRIAPLNQDAITLSDRKYRGQIEFNRVSGKITAINVLNIEDYLYGTVPSEMPSKWHIEAVKAQAVAARTYTTRTHKHTNQAYDLCDGTHCQAYQGYTNESENTTQAVKSTEGQKIYYNNELIDSIYFSSSGGYTDDAENVWANVFPYLKAVPDKYETEYKSWTKTVTLKDLNNLLNQNGVKIGNASSIKIDSYTDGGRVYALTILGTSGSKTLQKEEIRTFFNPSLESRMFEIVSGTAIMNDSINVQGNSSKYNKKLSDIELRGNDGINKSIGLNNSIYVLSGSGQILSYSTKSQTTSSTSDTFTLSGKGSGHGVGMSQYGAKGMAEAGFSYLDILNHYYTGVVIK